jgi:hypothetical protein
MKFKAASIIILLTFTFIGRAAAQATPYDSLSVDSLIGAYGVTNQNFVKGPVDGQEAIFGPSGSMSVQFAVNEHPVEFQMGAPVHIYWTTQTNDSNGAWFQFVELDQDLRLVRTGPQVFINETGPLNEPRMMSIAVPDTGYNTLQISVAIDSGANSFYLDAITIIQHGFAAVSEGQKLQASSLESFPNPFLHSANTTLRVTMPVSGKAILSVTDMLGREVMQLPLGNRSEGEQDVKVTIDHAGIFFARLNVNGEWTGVPLRITVE